MASNCQLILPPRSLSSCIAGCIVRDTRNVQLSDADRVNYFPASPLYSVSMFFEGQLHLAEGILPLEHLKQQPVAPRTLFLPPQSKPQMSWSAGPVLAATVTFFPDAWQQLGGTLDAEPSTRIKHALSPLAVPPLEAAWPKFWQEMAHSWVGTKGNGEPFDRTAPDMLKDWMYHLTIQLAQTGAGRSLRSMQRRLQRRTGLSKQTLDFFAKLEDVHRLISQDPQSTPAEVAADAGFADQSHMGRALKRATGFSPVTLNQKIASEEPFWCYRLLGERF